MSMKKNKTVAGKDALKSLDLAIKRKETGGTKMDDGYELNGRFYYNYIDNCSWEHFVTEMENKYPFAYAQYSHGSGGELRPRKYPPKMASYGSSSRMLYLLSRDIPGFCFEEQLPTTVGGIANLDGYLFRSGTHYYIEAKRREPYLQSKNEVSKVYLALYDDFKEKQDEFDYTELPGGKNISFRVKGKALSHFDLKQMICHLLGIATKHLKAPTEDSIHFLYLLYNPNEIKEHLDDINPKHSEEIFEIYKDETAEVGLCRDLLKNLYGEILRYLQKKYRIGDVTEAQIQKMSENFSFTFCDQISYRNILK